MNEIRFGAWEATVAPECGANIVSLKYKGKEILRAPESLEVLKGRPCMYGFPLILPANRVQDGKFTFQGREYTLPINEAALNNHIHGLLKDAPFQLLEHTENCVVTQIKNVDEYYPFPFTLTFRDHLEEDGWHREMTLENTGSMDMPYTLGFHATFCEPSFFRVPVQQAYEIDDRYLPTGRLLPLNTLQEKCRLGFYPDGTKINGSYTSAGNEVIIGEFTMSVSRQFDHWVIFNLSGNDGLLCIEPQCGAVNGLNSGKHRVLSAGEKETFAVAIRKTVE